MGKGRDPKERRQTKPPRRWQRSVALRKNIKEPGANVTLHARAAARLSNRLGCHRTPWAVIRPASGGRRLGNP